MCEKSCRVKLEEEVLEKYKVELSKRGAYRGRGEPSVEDGPESQKKPASKMWRRLLGKSLFVVQGVRFATKARHAGEPDGEGGDEAAAKDE